MAPLVGGGEHPGAGTRLVRLFGDAEFLDSFASSVKLFATGFALALALAVPLGIVLARLALLRVALESYILVLYVTPMVALIPFILSIIGFDFWPKVVVVVLFAFSRFSTTRSKARAACAANCSRWHVRFAPAKWRCGAIC